MLCRPQRLERTVRPYSYTHRFVYRCISSLWCCEPRIVAHAREVSSVERIAAHRSALVTFERWTRLFCLI